jgi:tetratricopeptide (TPR) repeat protein
MATRNRKSTTRRRKPTQVKTAARAKTPSSRGLRWGLALIGGVILATLVFWFLRSEPTRRESVSPAPRQASTPSESNLLAELRGAAETLLQIKDEELRLARQVKTSFPRDVQAWVLLGNVLYQHGDLPQAMDVWTQGLSLDPKHVKLHLRLGVAAADLGEPEQALACWAKALDINSNSPELRWRMANVHIDQGQHREAAALLEQACKIAPRATRNYFLLGQSYLQLQDYDKARLNYEKAIELSPDSYNAYYGLANVHLRLKDRDKAQVFMQRFRELKKTRDALPENQTPVDEVPGARMRMARRYMEAYSIYQKARLHPEGETLLKRAIDLAPENTKYLEKMGVHYHALRRLPEALGVFERARKIDPNNPLFYLNISKIYVVQKRFDQAERILSQTIARFPGNGLAHGEFAQLYLRSGRNAAQALELAQKAVQCQASASHYFLLSWACDVNRDYAGALRAIEKAASLAPKNEKYRMLHETIKQKM